MFNAALEAKIESIVKECPSYKSKIKKNSGCDYITCKSLPP